jgi:hypothetical protein
MTNKEYYAYVLGTNCKCGKAKLEGYVWCDSCWEKLPLYMQNILNDSIKAISNHVIHAMNHLGLMEE